MLLLLGPERTHMQPSRMPERRHEHEYFDLHAADLDQTLAKRNGRLVSQPAKHDVRHPFDLFFQRRLDPRVAIAMDGGPPGRHSVDQLSSVLESNPYALGTLDRKEWRRFGSRLWRCIGMPDDSTIALY